MSREPDDGPVERLLGERGQHLMRAAVALTGSRADAEDLLQAALERLLQNWRRIDTDPEGYLRRTLYNLAADGWRRRGRWRGRLAEIRSQARVAAADAEEVAVVDLRDTLVRLLRQLPPRQRAVVVLRYWEQRTEAETAELLGCTEGTVKSTAARGLRRLRELAGPALDPPGEADSRPPPAPDPHARAAPAPGGAEPGPRAATCHPGTLKTDLEVAGGRP
jgi:RNA polymerase sigma-70 factor (sigma-E family)